MGAMASQNHQPYDCLLNRLFGLRSKKTSKFRLTGLCAGNSPGTDEFPAQMASNAENVFIWWRHHDWLASLGTGTSAGTVKAKLGYTPYIYIVLEGLKQGGHLEGTRHLILWGLNTNSPRFADNIFKCIYLNKIFECQRDIEICSVQ